MNSILRLSFFLLLLILVSFGTSNSFAAVRPPNIVIIFADDLGYGDLECYGHPSIKTPHLDRMAAEGMRFTDFYVAACVCTPSRAALLTGRLPIRNGMAGGQGRHVLYPNSPGGLPLEEVTIAEALKTKGYATACIGKWHLGRPKEFLPPAHGFDYFFGIPFSNDMEPEGKLPRNASGLTEPDPKWWNVSLINGKEVIEKPTDQATLTKRYTEEAIRFIRENKKKPFFLYLPHTFPHVPLFASRDFYGKSARGIYGDTVEELDWSTGQILQALQKEKLDKNTLVVFTSDNGPWLVKDLTGGSGGLLRDGKGGTWEGGMRVPAIAWWPGKIKAGTVNRELAGTMDLFSTALSLAGVEEPKDRIMDGVDMTPMLLGKGASKRDMHFFYYGDELYAIRKGQFKAHFVTHDGYSKEPPQRHDPPALYHLGHDPSEKFNVAPQYPEVIAQILEEREKHEGAMVKREPVY
ncbi:MAG: sulfatase [Verrucomicrobia bacterium]|nr:sulfatase [Verrucomicrobiota bacterium]